MEQKIDPRTFAASTVALLAEDPARYRNFGVYWFFVKALLKRIGYAQENLYLLGEYQDQEVIDAMPKHDTLAGALDAATEEYRRNSAYNLGRPTVVTPDGEEVAIFDQDAGL